MRPTILDVARKLKLSITTVSRALDGYGDVAENTRRLVIQTAEEMGYVPDRAARQLRRRKTDTIGYVLPAISTGFADPFSSEFIAGLGDEAAAENYELLISSAQPASDAEKNLYQRWVQGRKVDGIVVNRVFLDDWRLKYLAEQEFPHVSMERPVTPADFIGIEVDSHKGLLMLMRHLIKQGRRRIAYIGGIPDLKIDHLRFESYQEGLQEAGIPADPLLIEHADLTSEGGFQSAKKLLSIANPPTAIVCINDLTAIGCMHAAHECGLEVGRDIAVAGFDGIADSAHTRPPLTTLDQPVYEIARQLVQMLLKLINHKPLEQEQIKVEPQLKLRASTGE
jgi:LacI family transcriptional regulator